MTVKKVLTLYAISLAIGFYTTFVLQSLWTWFAVPAFNVPRVGYWTMYGVNLIVTLLLDRGSGEETTEQRWKVAMMVLEACVPSEKREELNAELKNETSFGMWWTLGISIFGKLVGNTITLGLGWIISTVLV
jgi:hypothetical protein